MNEVVLAQSMNSAPGVGAWLARELGKLPESGIIFALGEKVWEEWSEGPDRS